MNNKKIRALLKLNNTFEGKVRLLIHCPHKFGKRRLRNKILNEALQLATTPEEAEIVFPNITNNLKLERICLIKMVLTNEEERLRAICQFSSERNFEGVLLEALKRRVVLAESEKNLNKIIIIAIETKEVKNSPEFQKETFRSARKFAKNKEALEMISLYEKEFSIS